MRIILADHHPQACSALKASLSAQPGFVLAGEVSDSQELLTLAQNKGVDLIPLDSELPGYPIEELIKTLHSLPSRPKVIAMSSRLDCGSAMLKAGPNVSYVYQEMAVVEEGGVLARQELPGSEGGRLAQVGISAGWDRRDNIVYPRSGSLFELGFSVSDDAIGSDFSFTTWNIALRRYFSISRSQVIAVRGLATFMMGTPPFQTLAMLGGDSVMRGYYAGRFRERQRYALQGEYRLGFWKRMGLTVSADVGDVAHDVADFHVDQMRLAGGLGLRVLLSKSEGVTLRADFGAGDDGSTGMYLSILEAY